MNQEDQPRELIQGRPMDPMDNVHMARAQSLLTGSLVGGVCPLLSKEQSLDVLRWAGEAA